MDVEQRARHPNPNVRVIEAARDYFPKDHYMYRALDHAAAELAVLHERCQRAALTPPDGYVLVPVEPTMKMLREAAKHDYYSSKDPTWRDLYQVMLSARPR